MKKIGPNLEKDPESASTTREVKLFEVLSANLNKKHEYNLYTTSKLKELIIMIKQKICTSLLLIFLASTSLFSFSVFAEVPKTSGSAPMQNIVVDGIINEAEWADGDWKVQFYLDIDEVFNPPDTDGFNYMYLGEDLTNLYLGLDLCSDQTGDPTDEWVGVWINVNNRSFNNEASWASYLNNGTESLIHDVENDDIFPFFRNQTTSLYAGWDVNNEDEYNAVHGTTEGDYTLFDGGSGPLFNITSSLITGDYLTQLDFAVDIKNWFYIFPEIYAGAVNEMRIDIESQQNTTITDQKLVFWYNDGSMNPNDPLQSRTLNTGTNLLSESFFYGPGNLSSEYIMKFSIIGNNSAPFMTQFDSIEFAMRYNYSNTFGGALSEPYVSIPNYDIEWSFGPSANNASDHRMFEISIPKIELEHYDANEEIGIIVGGYGTMTFPNELFWVFGAFNESIRQEESVNYNYYDMFGCAAPPQNPAIPGYYLPIVMASVVVSTIIIIRKRRYKLI